MTNYICCQNSSCKYLLFLRNLQIKPIGSHLPLCYSPRISFVPLMKHIPGSVLSQNYLCMCLFSTQDYRPFLLRDHILFMCLTHIGQGAVHCESNLLNIKHYQQDDDLHPAYSELYCKLCQGGSIPLLPWSNVHGVRSQEILLPMIRFP